MSEYLKIGVAALIPNLGGCIGGYFARKNIPDWYEHLYKPKWSPPTYVYPPVGICLHSLIGYASYLVWRDGGGFNSDTALPLTLYGTQLATGLAFSPIFFHYRKLGLATIDVGVVTGLAVATMISFHHINPTAGHLLLPGVGWCCFITAVTFSIWRSNKDRTD